MRRLLARLRRRLLPCPFCRGRGQVHCYYGDLSYAGLRPCAACRPDEPGAA